MIDTHALCVDVHRRIVFVLRLLNFLGSTTSKTCVANAFSQYVCLAFNQNEFRQDGTKINQIFRKNKKYY